MTLREPFFITNVSIFKRKEAIDRIKYGITKDLNRLVNLDENVSIVKLRKNRMVDIAKKVPTAPPAIRIVCTVIKLYESICDGKCKPAYVWAYTIRKVKINF